MAVFPRLDGLGPRLSRDQWTLAHAVVAAARLHADREFMAFEDGQRLTFAEFDRLTDQLAASLAQLGLEPGDRLLGLLTNSAEFMLLMIATHKRRAVFVPVNTEIRGAFLEHQVGNAEPKIIACDVGLLDRFKGLEHLAVDVQATITVDDGAEMPDALPPLLAGVPLADAAQLATEGTVRPGDVLQAEPSDVCTIMYTSGTTGPAKGVTMPQAHCYLFGLTSVGALGMTADDRYFCCMPLFHANALFMQVYASLLAGASVFCAKRFSVRDWLPTVIAQRATLTNALGVMPEFIYRSPPTPDDRNHLLRKVTAIPIASEWGEAFEQRFGVQIVQGFGMTEVNMVCFTSPDEPVESGCAGRVLDEAFEVVVADPATDRPLPAGEVGEILVRPKLASCFNAGYHKMEAKTVAAWRNLWFHTGDAGRFDERGRLFYVDRLNDRIRRRGENISSYEVEQVLSTHPGVSECAVVGIRVEGAGGEDEVKAIIAAVDGPAGAQLAADPAAFLDWCTPLMPRHSVPRYLQFVAELPQTASGKVRKQQLRDEGVGGDVWDRESVGYVVARG